MRTKCVNWDGIYARLEQHHWNGTSRYLQLAFFIFHRNTFIFISQRKEAFLCQQKKMVITLHLFFVHFFFKLERFNDSYKLSFVANNIHKESERASDAWPFHFQWKSSMSSRVFRVLILSLPTKFVVPKCSLSECTWKIYFQTKNKPNRDGLVESFWLLRHRYRYSHFKIQWSFLKPFLPLVLVDVSELLFQSVNAQPHGCRLQKPHSLLFAVLVSGPSPCLRLNFPLDSWNSETVVSIILNWIINDWIQLLAEVVHKSMDFVK